MSSEMFAALASVLTAIFTVFGVKMLDTISGGRNKRFDELAAIRAGQQTRIESLETKLDNREKEFDAYQQATNLRFEQLNGELWKLRAENRELTLLVERYEKNK